MFKEVVISFLISILILVVFMFLGSLFSGNGGEILIIALSIQFTIVLSTLIILEKLEKNK